MSSYESRERASGQYSASLLHVVKLLSYVIKEKVDLWPLA